jgi:hypothetical protein
MRKRLLIRWKGNVVRSSWAWLRTQPEDVKRHPNTRTRGAAAIHFAQQASWWDWNVGSAVFFWRWPEEFVIPLRDDVPPLFLAKPPHTKDTQKPYRDPELREKESKKILKARLQNYLLEGFKSLALINVFSVAKGPLDIRMFYDDTKSGLNDCLFVPWFMLRTSSSMTRTLDVNYFCGDTDLGECFLNFWAHQLLIPYLGVDVTHTFPDEARNAFGNCEPFVCRRTGLFSAVLLLVA